MIADDETGNMVTAWSLFFPNKLQQWRAIKKTKGKEIVSKTEGGF